MTDDTLSRRQKMRLYRLQSKLDGVLPQSGVSWRFSETELDKSLLMRLQNAEIVTQVDDGLWRTHPGAAQYIRESTDASLAEPGTDDWIELARGDAEPERDDLHQATLTGSTYPSE